MPERELQVQYHVLLVSAEQLEKNIWHRAATDVLPFQDGNPVGWRTYRDRKHPGTLTFAALETRVAQTFYDALKSRMPAAYIVPPTEVRVA